MIKKVVYIIVLLVIFSCQSVEKAPKPEKLIAKDKMVTILTDIAFVKAAKGAYKKQLEVEKVNLEDYILKKHDIDSVTFAENNKWYASRLDEYGEIFAEVKVNLQKEKKKYEKLKKEEDSIKKVKDSIKKSKGLKVEEKIQKLNTELIYEKEIQEQAKQKRFKIKGGSKNN